MLELEHFFACPYCGETISMFLDISVRKQQYIEDCEVCCNPIQINYEFENETLLSFSANSIEQ
ncbi:CPXCG motif-containing cysteine-rich protein [Fulvivirga sediminis]|uniref:CPXCG motif-containing cysteine-rich protein n=1 Tax=Fulvivirga sediminis TaxID=2803949 RepID=A0A937F2I6_9BACT|nr:CPXCG motif-containing cysteine-rich protein [Fulvivirga sediminis]MBL3654530.1 CPXCG motif-containing cysteine-rich protein [Fulvivirga sediminis]